MYCNFYINMVNDAVKGIDKIKEVKSIENDDSIIVSVITEPIFSISEINLILELVKKSVELSCNKKVYVTRNMEVFCDIVNLEDKEITNEQFDLILNKVKKDNYENV